MAKSNSFFSIRRGSTKSHTYSGWQGQQVTKDRVITVKNPRSAAQQEQRQKFAAVGNFYKYLKFILNHSWEGVSYGVNSYNKFMSLNVKNFNAASMIIPEYGSKVAEAGTYQVSEGSLATPENSKMYISGYEEGGFVATLKLYWGAQTAKGLKDLFGNLDYVTLVGLYSTVQPDGSPNVNYQTKGFAIRLHKPTVADDTAVTQNNLLTVMDAELVNIDSSQFAASVGEQSASIVIGTSTDEGSTTSTGVYALCASLICSKSDGTSSSAILRNNAVMKLTEGVSALVDATNASNAESWPVGADYLLNGETVTPTAG